MTTRALRCAVSIDVDPIPCYYRIHGLGAPPAELRDVILRRCVPRFADLLARRGIPATFFVVGGDVDVGRRGAPARAARALVRELDRAGHEIGNHSYSHPYELARLPEAEAADEIGRAHDLLGDAVGRAIRGFRAPGYDISAAMLRVLARLGYRYDSSVFPSPLYYAAKAAVMACLAVTGALGGRGSGAVLTDPRALLAPAQPYRPALSAPWRRARRQAAPLVEVPIAVTPRLRLPVIGTSLLLAPGRVRDRLLASMRGPVLNLELHGVDLCDADADGIPGELVARQPDLRVSLARKRAALEATLDRIGERFAFVPLGDVAAGAR